ncbi:MAG: hypothetical protein ACLP4V_22500 [Methylocella sp.]
MPQRVEASADLAASNFAVATRVVHCHLDGAQAGGPKHQGPCPCQSDCCCCQLVHAPALIAPSGVAETAYAPLLAETVVAAETLGSYTWPAAFAGRPRGPPALI